MLGEDDRRTVCVFKERLLAEGVPVVEALVYGSRARGDFVPDSDLDVCLVLETVDQRWECLIDRIAWEVGFERDRVITTVEYTQSQLQDSPLRESPFVKAIAREGVAV